MSGIMILELPDPEKQRLQKLYSKVHERGQSFIKTKPGDLILPRAYGKYKEQIYNLKVRHDDVFILTWPKNGTTWTQEMVWLIENGCPKIEDIPEPAKNIFSKIPVIDIGFLMDFVEPKPPGASFAEIYARLESMTSPRLIRSHLPYSLLPPGLLDQCKAVTCLRNPKDTVVSFYHFEKLFKNRGFVGSFAEYFDLFMDDLCLYGQYWNYTLEAWRYRDHPNLCLLFFEDMKADLESSVQKVAQFLGKSITDEQVKFLVENLTFKKMKANVAEQDVRMKKVLYSDTANKDDSFLRKGEVGDWKNYFTDEMNERMDQAIERHFKGTGLEFRFE